MIPGFALYQFITWASCVLGGPEVFMSLLVASGAAIAEATRAAIELATVPWHERHPYLAALSVVAAAAALVGVGYALHSIDLDKARGFVEARVSRGLLRREDADELLAQLARRQRGEA